MMNSARELLLHQSIEHLLTARYTVEAAFDERLYSRADADAARDLGFSLFASMNEVLKLTLDLDDPDTFSRVERAWAQMFDDVWLPSFPREDLAEAWSDRRGTTLPPELMALLRRREVLRFGLVMWIGHLLARAQSPEHVQHLGQAFSQLASRFGGVEWALDAFDAAQDDERGSTPWTRWFLQELPEEQAHFIPTASNLLWAALLLSARRITSDDPPALRPRDWFTWRRDEIAAALDRLEREREPWQSVLGVPGPFGGESGRDIGDPSTSWTARVGRLRQLLAQGAEDQQRQERAIVRATPLDESRIAELRERTLVESTRARVLRDTVELQAHVASLPSPPEGYKPLVSRSWMPRSFFVVGSRVAGLDMLARDLARPMRDAERQQLSAALPELAPEADQSKPVAAMLRDTIGGLRDRGFNPTLMILPLNWRLERELGLSGLGAIEVEHDLVPPIHRREFCGVFDDVPALDLAGTPQDRIWLLDVQAAIQFEEWPSERQSGLRFELLSFDQADSAAIFLDAHPEVAESHTSRQDAIETLQERVLITLHLCWRITAGNADAVGAVAVPVELQRDE